MGLKNDFNELQPKINGVVAALNYGYFSHMNKAGVSSVSVTDDSNKIQLSNIGKSNCGTNAIKTLVHGFQVAYNTNLINDDTVCDPKDIPNNCMIKDKNGYIQKGCSDELYIDYPINNIGKKNAMSWTEGTISSTSRYWESVCYGNDKFVTVAYNSNYFAYSTDGINWIESTISSTSRYWESVCYGNDKFVAVAYNSNYFAYSTDGINWTEGTISNTSIDWRSVCYGNDKFVAVVNGSNYFAYSTDGITWTEGNISSTNRYWWSVCYGNGKYVAVADQSNYFAYSTDGINWTEGNISTSRSWRSICYGNDKFVAVTYNNKYFAYSTDGITWTESTISDTNRKWFSICYGNDKFVTVLNGSNYFAYCSIYPTINYNNTKSTYKSRNILNSYRDTSSLSNTQTKIPSSNTRYIDQYLNIFYSSTNYGNISINTITGSQVLKDAITNGTAKFIANKFYVSSSWSDYNNEQFYRYLIFNDSDDNYYLAITSDMMSFTTYQLPEDNYSFGIMNGTIYMYIPEKDSIAMITRHPVTTDVITIDGNDPENSTDYTKPYYRLIEIPFLKKYYKYSGKHVKNVAIGVIGTMSNSTSIFGSYKYPSDCTLLINVFDKIYRIGVPNFNADNILANNSKRLQEFYTSDEQTSDSMANILPVSSMIGKYDSSTTNISCNINSRHFDVVTDSNINITTDQMNVGYDSDIDETAPTTNKFISNYTYCGANSLSDLSTPASVIYPNANY